MNASPSNAEIFASDMHFINTASPPSITPSDAMARTRRSGFISLSILTERTIIAIAPESIRSDFEILSSLFDPNPSDAFLNANMANTRSPRIAANDRSPFIISAGESLDRAMTDTARMPMAAAIIRTPFANS